LNRGTASHGTTTTAALGNGGTSVAGKSTTASAPPNSGYTLQGTINVPLN
jgi:hypothetical protein